VDWRLNEGGSEALNGDDLSMADTQNILLEFYKTTLDYRARVISIIFASGIAVAIPNVVTFFDNDQKSRNDILRIELERDVKDKEIQIKELELKLAAADKHQNYIGQFINQAIDKDIELRIRFAEYFATVSDEPERWEKFLVNLVKKRDECEAKSRTLADEQRKETPDDDRLSSLASDIEKLEGQVRSTTDQPRRVSSQTRRPSLALMLHLFGRPVKEIKEGKDQVCQTPDIEHFKQLVQAETIDDFSVNLIKPAFESLKRILDQVEQNELALRKSISVARSLCVRNERGTTRLDPHSFGTAINITIDRQSVPIGRSGTPEVAEKLRRISDYFEHAGWVWGGRTDPGFFEVGSDLLDQWENAGTLRAVGVVEANR
jgi:hypothetical protein